MFDPACSLRKTRVKWHNNMTAIGVALIVSLLAFSYVSVLAVTSVVDYGTYTIYKDSTTTYAKNMSTGVIDYSSTVSATVFNDVFSALPNGGVIFVKAGTYTINSTITATAKGIQ